MYCVYICLLLNEVHTGIPRDCEFFDHWWCSPVALVSEACVIKTVRWVQNKELETQTLGLTCIV